MATPVLMPKQGQSVETCIITKWFKRPGDKVITGDLLFSYETDKASFDLESPVGGTLLEIFFDDGAEVPVLINVAVIGQPGESTAPFLPGGLTGNETASTVPSIVKEQTPVKQADQHNIIKQGDSRVRISPRAKKLAEEKGIDYLLLNGSGPNGRIIVSDIEKALPTKTSANILSKKSGDEYSEQPLSNVRKIIAKAMHASLQNSAQLTHHMSADVRRLLDARKKIKDGLATGREKQDITLNDIVCWCVIRALEKYPEANAHFLGDSIKTYNRVHLGIAVDTPRGLMVPAVKNADTMDIRQLSVELKAVADASRKGSIDPELIKSTAASFTVSNLGNYGVELFTPVINLPQAAILGVCTIVNRPVDVWNNQYVVVPFIGLSLTYDHRAIDGGPATLFLKEIKEQIERFEY